jgi:tetratricopeptide (TPR) repeat protein
VFEEGQAFANAIGDRRGLVYLSVAYGRTVGATGDWAAELELANESWRAALEVDDVAVRADAWSLLTSATLLAGRLPQALEMAEEGSVRFSHHRPSAQWIAGLNPYSAFSLLRAICLSSLGRLSEGFDELDRCRQLAETDGTPEMAAYALFWATKAHYYAHDAERALASASQCAELSRRLGDPPMLAVMAHVGFCYAHLAAERGGAAIEPARAALDLQRRAANKWHVGTATLLLAEALLETGELTAAATTAAEAIALSLRADMEAVAHGIRARALLRRDGVAARDAVTAELDSAAVVIEHSGARTLTPALCEWRAELASVVGDEETRVQLLRQAQHGYEEIGAPGHAKRLSKALTGDAEVGA